MLSWKQIDEISVDDLARLILSKLQSREVLSDEERNRRFALSYPWRLSDMEEEIFSTRSRQDVDSYDGHHVLQRIEAKFAQAQHSLFTANYIYRDPTQGSEEFVRITEKGRKLNLSAPIFGVTSTDGFIQAIRGQGSPLDAVVEGYLRESYSAAEAGLWLSSTFMLGAASERLLFIVAEHVDTLLKDSSESEKLARLWKVREVKEWIVNHLPALKRTYRDHKNAFTDVEDVFDTLFALYRYQRNEAGHPREVLPSLDPSQIRSMLLGFGTFQSRAYAILAVEP